MRSMANWCLALALSVFTLPVMAQDQEINPNDPFDTNVLRIVHGTDTRLRYRVGYELHNNVGERLPVR